MEFIVSGVMVKTMTGHCSKSVLLKWPVLQESKNIPSHPICTEKFGNCHALLTATGGITPYLFKGSVTD